MVAVDVAAVDLAERLEAVGLAVAVAAGLEVADSAAAMAAEVGWEAADLVVADSEAAGWGGEDVAAGVEKAAPDTGSGNS